MAGGFLTSENAIREIERKPFDAKRCSALNA
jgi:hypothetical protein